MTRRPIRTFFAADGGWIHNLGDALVPYILEALGFDCISMRVRDAQVVNPDRCLLVIGSLLTAADLRGLELPIDVWGCGWKGHDAWRGHHADATFHAVRGPLTRSGIGLTPAVALGDPALLLPHLYPRRRQANGLTVLFQHIDRIGTVGAYRRAVEAGCDLIRSTWVYAAPGVRTVRSVRVKSGLGDLFRWSTRLRGEVHPLWGTIDLISGASFILTGSLHGAILAQAYGIPWAAFDDGYVDSPSKWEDWGAYLGVDIAFVKDLREGREWWTQHGMSGRLQPLAPLLAAFPFLGDSRTAQQILQRVCAAE